MFRVPLCAAIRLGWRWCCAVAFFMVGVALPSWTAAQLASSTDATVNSADGLSAYSTARLSAYPPNLKFGGGSPMMMLVASRDHTLFAPIYTDFEDVDGDGVMDYTYNRTFRYYGYFDPGKCYAYNGARSGGLLARFEPKVLAASVGEDKHLACPSTGKYWLGNFLNWATMTRIDVVRKMLYGGYRAEDTATDTTLQMAHMSKDAHSFVKFYGGADVRDFTPFDATTDLQRPRQPVARLRPTR
jgi:type IV pilus assembly protein PilY1